MNPKPLETKVVSVPNYAGTGNPYQKLFYDALAGYGVECLSDFEFRLAEIWRRRSDFRVLHIHWLYPRNLGALADAKEAAGLFFKLGLCRVLGIRIVWTAHNLVPHDTGVSALQYLRRLVLVRGADLILVHFEKAGEALRKTFGIPGARTIRMPHGNYAGFYPDAVGRAAARKELGLGEKEAVFLFFGILRPYKNLECLIEAFRGMKREEARLLVAGPVQDETFGRTVKALTRHDPRIILHPEYIPDERLQYYFQAADCVVLPYRKVFTSGAALLALTFRKPLIMNRCPFSEEYFDEHSAILVEPCGPDSIRGAMERFLARRRHYFVGAALAEKYAWDRIMADLVSDPRVRSVFGIPNSR